ncbi:START-like domain superfamily [Fusarium oxysporum f. sp. vasinfectum]|nr:START-like domain superfamily [Fusarium oxysporum f. sp. vasinfectum]
MQSAIIWPTKFLPGTTDNYVSNEVISYHAASRRQQPQEGRQLQLLDFRFSPFPAEVMESLPPSAGSPGRLAWRAWVDGDESSKLDVYHAWIVEDLEYGVVRILTQESQIGQPAAKLAATKPNPMLNGHQEWLDSLVSFTKQKQNTLS